MKRRRLITKRTGVRLTLLLVAGAIVTATVAWASALVLQAPLLSKDIGTYTSGAKPPRWRMEKYTSTCATRIVWLAELIELSHFPHTSLELADGEPLNESPHASPPPWCSLDYRKTPKDVIIVIELATGWPTRSLLAYAAMPAGSPTAGFVAKQSIVLGNPEIEDYVSARLIPLRPLWPGFAINTVFYAFILWLLFALGGTPFALRRRLRVKRGLCPKCAYDLRGRAPMSDVCPECGAFVLSDR